MSRAEQRRARVIFFRAMATMMQSGIHILRALDVLHVQCEDPSLKELLRLTIIKVSQGQSLSKALGSTPALNPIHVQLVAVGERTGRLHHIFGRIAQDVERADEVQSRLTAALVYPLLVLAAALLLVLMMQNLVFKDLLEMLRSLSTSLPWPTLLLSWSCRICSNPFTLTLGAVALGAAMRYLWRGMRQPSWRCRAWLLVVETPAIGKALRQAAAIQFARTLATCINAGVMLPQALDMAGKSTLDPTMAEAMGGVVTEVTNGRRLAPALSETGLFPPMLIHCVAAGEQVGRIPFLLERVADTMEGSLEQALEAAAALLQPVVLALVGAIVAFVVIATLLPMLKVVDSL